MDDQELTNLCMEADEYRKKGKLKKAIDICNKVLQLRSSAIGPYVIRGLAISEQGNIQAGCADVFQAGLMYIQEKNKHDALECIRLLSVINPSSPLIDKLTKLMGKI